MHHENEDGSGYLHVTSDNIPIGAKIIHIADVYDAMTHKRCYKDELTIEETIKQMESNVGKMFDESIFEAFKKLTALHI